MAEQKTNSNAFKEAVCIDAGRIYDSCSEKDCSCYKHFNIKRGPFFRSSFLHFFILCLMLPAVRRVLPGIFQ